MPSSCAVPSCRYRPSRAKDAQHKKKRSLFRFPLDIKRAGHWAAQIPGLKHTDINVHTKICDIHFKKEFVTQHVINEHGTIRSVLSLKAVPTLNLSYSNKLPSYGVKKEPPRSPDKNSDFLNGRRDNSYLFCKVFKDNFQLFCSKLPSTWKICQLTEVAGEEIILYLESEISGSQGFAITHRKAIILKNDDSLSFHVNGARFTNSPLTLVKSVRDLNTLRNIMMQFAEFKICEGIDQSYIESSEKSLFVRISPRNYRLTNCFLYINQNEFICTVCNQYKLSHVSKNNSDGNVEIETYSFFKDFNDNFEFFNDILPSSWEISKNYVEDEDMFMFLLEYSIDGFYGGYIVHKKLIALRSDDTVSIYINGKSVTEGILPPIKPIKDMNTLQDLVLQIDRLRICEGVDESNLSPAEMSECVKFSPRNYRPENCTLIVEHSERQCQFCHENF